MDNVHRVGRTGCRQHTGDAFTLVTSENFKLLAAIEQFIGQKPALEGFAEGSPLSADQESLWAAPIRFRTTGRGIAPDQTYNPHS
jgi:superfamily II DNA/RNA helicase